MDCIVLDVMGVVFQAADDVAELLVPFVVEHGGERNEDKISEAYLAASLGDISADDFWYHVGLTPEIEDSYLSLHNATSGLTEFFSTAKSMGIPVWLLSNDVNRWSEKLRTSFDISPYLQGAVISGEARSRKPDIAIYELLVRKSGFSPEQMLFFDDRQKNVSAALGFGIPSVLFDTAKGFSSLTERLRARVL